MSHDVEMTNPIPYNTEARVLNETAGLEISRFQSYHTEPSISFHEDLQKSTHACFFHGFGFSVCSFFVVNQHGHYFALGTGLLLDKSIGFGLDI